MLFWKNVGDVFWPNVLSVKKKKKDSNYTAYQNWTAAIQGKLIFLIVFAIIFVQAFAHFKDLIRLEKGYMCNPNRALLKQVEHFVW